MESKKSLTLRGMRVLFFSILYFASFTAHPFTSRIRTYGGALR